MRLFFELAKRSFQRHLAYRAAALAGLATNFVFGMIRAAILLALYGERSVMEGMSTQDAVTYTALSQAVIAFLALFGWYDLMNTVHNGDIAADLLKPMNYFSFWLAQDFGRAFVALLWRGVPIMGLYALLFDLTYPSTIEQWSALALSLLLAWLVCFSWYFLINLAAFWTPNARGIGRLGFVIAWFFSGFLMPLRFFPEWVARLAYLTPFPHMLNTVVEVYLGVLSRPALLQALLLQAVWAAGLILLGQFVLRIGVRRLVILGG